MSHVKSISINKTGRNIGLFLVLLTLPCMLIICFMDQSSAGFTYVPHFLLNPMLLFPFILAISGLVFGFSGFKITCQTLLVLALFSLSIFSAWANIIGLQRVFGEFGIYRADLMKEYVLKGNGGIVRDMNRTNLTLAALTFENNRIKVVFQNGDYSFLDDIILKAGHDYNEQRGRFKVFCHAKVRISDSYVRVNLKGKEIPPEEALNIIQSKACNFDGKRRGWAS